MAAFDFNEFEETESPSSAPQFAVAVVEPIPGVRLDLEGRLGPGVSGFETIEAVLPRLVGSPMVVVLGPSCSDGDVLSSVERSMSGRPDVGVVLVADELSTTILQLALRSGVKDVLTLQGDTSQIAEAIERIGSNLRSDNGAARVSSLPVVTGGGDDSELGRVTTVFSTKGGSGKSVIAVNLAVVLAERSDGPVVLVDADLQFGDVAVMMKLAPSHTVVDAVSNIERLDASLLESLLATHEASGLRVLPAPLEPAFADQIGASDMVKIIEILRRFCSHVVIDTPAYFNDVVLGIVEVSDDVLLVAGMDIPNIKNVKIGLQTLRLLNTPMEKLRLILNRANSKVKLDIGGVERTLQISADALVPSDVVVPQSVNKGVPFVISHRKSGVAKSIRALADTLLNVDVDAEVRRRRG
ncbi:MAG: pilus assembly protein CpaE [Verrucomicrobiales bacterium]|jgi:pilus assembly protein CpaE